MDSNSGPWSTRGGKSYYNRGGRSYHRRGIGLNRSPTSTNSLSSVKSKLLQYNLDDEDYPYKAWRLYFTDETYMEDSPTHKKIVAFEKFILSHKEQFPFKKIAKKEYFMVDLLMLDDDIELKSNWKNFKSDLNSRPEHTLKVIGLAMHHMILRVIQGSPDEILENDQQQEETFELPVIYARVENHEPILQLKNLKVNYYGKLVSIRGTVIRVGNVKLICRWMVFGCEFCGGTQVLRQPDGIYTTPSRCDTKGCRAQSKFIPLFSSPHTRTENWQILKLQELLGNDESDGGRIPRTVECELTNDLVKTCSPGDDVTITGIVKVRNFEEARNKNKQAALYVLYMDAITVVNNKNETNFKCENADSEFSVNELYAVKRIHADPHVFKLLVHSLCPSIYGHEMVKAGLLLGLFGGASTDCVMRADLHVLMVGDPGLGKSKMLQACSNVAPRGVFVCGNTSTSSGLTVTMTRETGGDYSLEAGALVLADQGCCCIDEFDKMPTQHAALLEAMEQQSVSIAKAGVVCTLPARTTILAAANPAGGHYNKAKTVAENLRIGAALLSRFDLVFILCDKPNQVLDSLLSEHVLALHTGSKYRRSANQSFVAESSQRAKDYSLQHTLKSNANEEIQVVTHSVLRKYIAYAKKFVRPKLSVEAAAVLKKFYLDLRKQYQTMDSTPITTRQAMSLMRLTLARAKLELREIANEQDALDVIDVMKYSLIDTFSDKQGNLNFGRSQHGSGMSQKNKLKTFMGILQRKAALESRSEFTTLELKEVAQNGGIGDKFYELINMLNIHGFLLKKDSNKYKLLSIDM